MPHGSFGLLAIFSLIQERDRNSISMMKLIKLLAEIFFTHIDAPRMALFPRSNLFCAVASHIGGTSPFFPTLIRLAVSVPSAFFSGKNSTCAPGCNSPILPNA